MPTLEKVTAVITREQDGTAQILLLRHPYAGLQLPAGTVEPDETPAAAVLREAREETGLETTIVAELGVMIEEHGDTWRVVVEDTPVYTRPDASSATWAHLRRGLSVTASRRRGDWTQVSYVEHDSLEPGAPVSCRITGWVPDSVLAVNQRRTFFRLAPARAETPREWTVHSDHHDFVLFWTPIAVRPRLVDPQEGWLVYLRDECGVDL